MSELLSSLDVVNQGFKKTMRGYDPAEVDEFLDRVAECIQAYVQKNKDYERSLEEMGEKLNDYEQIKNSLHETLLMAQRTAEEKVTNATAAADERLKSARSEAEGIVSDARSRAERIIREAETGVAELANGLKQLEALRTEGYQGIRSVMGQITNIIDTAEVSGKIQIPDFAEGFLRRNEGRQVYSAPQPAAEPEIQPPSSPAGGEGVSLQEISNTLNTLGIDPSLLSVKPGAES